MVTPLNHKRLKYITRFCLAVNVQLELSARVSVCQRSWKTACLFVFHSNAHIERPAILRSTVLATIFKFKLPVGCLLSTPNTRACHCPAIVHGFAALFSRVIPLAPVVDTTTSVVLPSAPSESSCFHRSISGWCGPCLLLLLGVALNFVPLSAYWHAWYCILAMWP